MRAVSISADGQKVAFASTATNLVPDDGIPVSDIFVYEVTTSTQTLASRSSSGIYGNAGSYSPSLSGDGESVAFVSEADNLVSGDTNEADDIFVRNLKNGTTVRASTSSANLEANALSRSPSLSNDGTLVTFSSEADNLIETDHDYLEDVFLKNITTNTTLRVSNGINGEPDGASWNPAISGDGQVIAFVSNASNLVPNDTNLFSDVFVYDRSTGVTTLVSVSSAGVQGNKESGAGQLSISDDGRYVLFTSAADNLVENDTNELLDVFVHDRITQRTGLLSKSARDIFGNGSAGGGAISGDGKMVAIASNSTNLVSGDSNDMTDVFQARIGALPAVFKRSTPIEKPPTLVSNNRRLRIVMQFFSMTGTDSAKVYRALKGKGKRLVYVVTIRTKADTRRRTAKRNAVTITNMDPGSYAVSYHVEVRQGDKVVAKSKESKKQKLTIVS